MFVAGYSNGAIMAYRLACEMSERITAAAIFAGSLGMKKVDQEECKGIFLNKGLFHTWDT